MTKVIFLDPAWEEMPEAARWYDDQEAGVGHEFLSEVDEAIDRLLFDPTARPLAGRSVYRQVVDRFPFDLLYRIGTEQIEIVAVSHHRRKPGYWHHRRHREP